MEWVLLGRVTYDYLITGTITALVVACLVVGVLLVSESRLRLAASVFTNSREGIIVTDANGRIVDVNPGFTRITGYERAEVLGKTPGLLRSGHQDAAFYERMWRALHTTGTWCGEVWNRRKSGELYPETLTINTVVNEGGRIRHYVGVFSDISLLKAHEADLERIAYYAPIGVCWPIGWSMPSHRPNVPSRF